MDWTSWAKNWTSWPVFTPVSVANGLWMVILLCPLPWFYFFSLSCWTKLLLINAELRKSSTLASNCFWVASLTSSTAICSIKGSYGREIWFSTPAPISQPIVPSPPQCGSGFKVTVFVRFSLQKKTPIAICFSWLFKQAEMESVRSENLVIFWFFSVKMKQSSLSPHFSAGDRGKTFVILNTFSWASSKSSYLKPKPNKESLFYHSKDGFTVISQFSLEPILYNINETK